MDKLLFNEAEHVYTLERKSGNIILPGVTTILNEEGITNFDAVPKERLEMAQYRGTCVHTATELYDKGILDLDSLAPEWLPYLEAWIAFKDEHSPKFIAIEERIYHPTYMYAGTIDRVEEDYKVLAIVDVKTGTPCRGNQVQLKAYAEAYRAFHKLGRKKIKRYCVYLRPDGTFTKGDEFEDDDNDINVFLSALTMNNWKGRIV